ncbi:MAG TPA: hypothetical protein VMX75_09275, partial [Spirochaetia bacterium]|nr:hypothetical protein [Spirochaetia bacterium]
MVISIALFGLTASGIFLHLTKRRYSSESPALHLERTVPIFVCLFSVSTIVSFLAVNRIPLDYFKLSTEPAHSLYLVAIFLLLSLPFFFSGMISAFAYSYIPEKSGKIYFASMLGSALGALLPMVLIPILGVRETLLAAALCPVAFILPLMLVGGLRSGGFWPAPLTLTGLTLLLFFFPGIGKIDPSPYKLLSQFKRYPDSRIVESRDTIRGRFDYLQSPYIRYAPGLSLRYGKPVTAQTSIIRDGDSQLVLYDRDLSFSRFCLSFVGYHLFPDADSALIIQKGGGLSLACALSSKVRLIEL